MKVDFEQLKTAFEEAEKAALAAKEENQDDGGTCNFDTPAFQVKGARVSKIKQVAEQAGLTVNEFHWFSGKRWFWLNVTLDGMAALRSRMSTAATKALKEHAPEGVTVMQYCQMD
jgi:hypothetical protein